MGSVGQLSKDIYSDREGREMSEKGARKSWRSRAKRIGRLDGREPTDLSGGMFGGRVRERNAYCRSAEPNRGELEAFAHASVSYNSLISPQAYLFRT